MRKYVPISLDAFLNESKTILLKRKYGENEPIVVGSNAPLRNQILTYVNENNKVSKEDLKKFISDLNEESKNPIASTNMWMIRNAKFFITENRNGITYYKLSDIGKRLVNNLSHSIYETDAVRRRIRQEFPRFEDFEEGDDDFDNNDEDNTNYDFLDRSRGKSRPGIYDEMVEEENPSCEIEETNKNMDESSKERIKQIIENIKSKSKNKLNEEDELEDDENKDIENKSKEEDELTFDDLDLDNDEDEDSKDEEISDEESEEEKVEITEFIITVANVEEAINELSELDVTAEQVMDEEGEPIEDQIKVSAENWEPLKGWLEEKGVDIEEMFGGEIEVEEAPEEKDLSAEEDLDELEDLEGNEETNLEDLNSKEDTLEDNTEDLKDNKIE